MSDTNAERIDDDERDIVRSTARFQKLKPILRLSVVTGAIVIKIAVVPLDQVAIDVGYRTKPRQFTGSSRALQRTRQHFRENRSGQPFSKTSGVALAAFRQRQIGKSCMLTRDTPGSLPVARQINYRNNFAHHCWSID